MNQGLLENSRNYLVIFLEAFGKGAYCQKRNIDLYRSIWM